MAEAILAKGLSRPIDTIPTDGSSNLITSGGVKAAIDAIEVGGGSVPEVHIGDSAPTSSEVVWFDTSAMGVNANYVLEKDLELIVDPSAVNTRNAVEDTIYSSITAALSNIPKNLNNHDVTIKVKTDNTPILGSESFTISNYFGGTICITSTSGGFATHGEIYVNNSSVKFKDVSVTCFGIQGNDNATILLENSSLTFFQSSSSGCPLLLTNGSKFITNDSAEINFTSGTATTAVKASYLSQIYIDRLTGDAIDGLVAEQGSVITINKNELEVSGAMYSTSSGGRIFTDGYSSIANY